MRKENAALLQQGGDGRNGIAGRVSISTCDCDTALLTCQPCRGRIEGDTWRKTVRRSAHMLRKPPAWAVDLDDLMRVEQCGVRWLELRETEQGVTYRVALETLRRRGRSIDRGCGRQIALLLGYWQMAEPAQLTLFGVSE